MTSLRRITAWDDRLDALIAESSSEGFRFLSRLRDDWLSGANRFDQLGESLCAVFDDEFLLAVGGLNRVSESAARLRRVYVTKAARRRGIGRQLVAHLLMLAREHYRQVVLRTDTKAAGDFYLTLGFEPVTGSDVTHCMTLRGCDSLA